MNSSDCDWKNHALNFSQNELVRYAQKADLEALTQEKRNFEMIFNKKSLRQVAKLLLGFFLYKFSNIGLP